MASPLLQIVSLSIITYLLQKFIRKYLQWRALTHIPGPNSPFLLGCFHQIQKEPFLEPHKRWWKEVGYDAPLLRYSSILGANSIFILDPEIVKDILMSPTSKKETARFCKPNFSLTNLLGEGLVTTEGEKWMRHRKLVQPAFAVSNIRKFLGEAVPPKVERLVQLWKKAAVRDDDDDNVREIDLSSHLSALTLDVIGQVAFSHTFPGMDSIQKWANNGNVSNKSETGEIVDPLINALNQYLKPSLIRVMLFIVGCIKADGFINPSSVRAIKELNRAADSILENAKEKELSSSSSSQKGKSVMQLLLEAKKVDSSCQQLDDVELRDELKTFLLAGHETTSAWCYWAIFALSKYPDIQEKVHHDVMKHTPMTEGSSISISIEQVESMSYFNAFMTEVLRFYPPVGLIVRNNQHEEIFAGHRIPPKTALFLPIHLLHRHPKYWKDPDMFLPERWLDDVAIGGGSIGSNIKGFTFLPFSFGGRNCIGYRFATMEAQLIMATIVRSLRVEIAPSQRDEEFTFTAMVTMKSKPAVKIVVKERMQE